MSATYVDLTRPLIRAYVLTASWLLAVLCLAGAGALG